MTEQQRQLGRRNFLKAVATLPPATALAWHAGSLRPVRAGLIGPGLQGRVLLENAPPHALRIVAVADIFPPNLQKGVELARRLHDPEAAAYNDYRQLLARADIEAVVVAVPLWMHAQVVMDAVTAGKHVLVEKMMAYTAEECTGMIEAARRARVNLQVGHQRAYNPLYHEARELLRRGTIGDVYHVRAVWHRNGDWRRPVPADAFDPRPHGYPDLEHYVNWRLYTKYSKGLLSELCCHQIHAVNWFLDRAPVSVMGTGGIHRYDDGRELNDHDYAIFEYPGRVTLSYSSIQSNAFDHYYEEFMGTKGTIVLSGEQEAMLFTEGEGSAATQISVTPATSEPLLEASESRSRDAAGSAAIGQSAGAASALAPYRLELEGFARAIRNGDPNLCDGDAGLRAALPIVKAREAIAGRTRVDIAWPPEVAKT